MTFDWPICIGSHASLKQWGMKRKSTRMKMLKEIMDQKGTSFFCISSLQCLYFVSTTIKSRSSIPIYASYVHTWFDNFNQSHVIQFRRHRLCLSMNGLIKSKHGSHPPMYAHSSKSKKSTKKDGCKDFNPKTHQTNMLRAVVRKNIINAKVLVFLSTLRRHSTFCGNQAATSSDTTQQLIPGHWSLQNQSSSENLDVLWGSEKVRLANEGLLIAGLSEASFLDFYWGYGKSGRSFRDKSCELTDWMMWHTSEFWSS